MGKQEVKNSKVGLERDGFLRSLLNHLSGSLQDTIGLEEASGFISEVGQRMGDEINQQYRANLDVSKLSKDEVAEVLVDLKKRIKGEFSLIEETDEKLVFGNTRCPFEDKVKGRPSLCMMTSNVFGTIAASNLGYAKVVLNETIANGDKGCKVTVYLKKNEESQVSDGREYYGVEE